MLHILYNRYLTNKHFLYVKIGYISDDFKMAEDKGDFSPVHEVSTAVIHSVNKLPQSGYFH